MYVYIWFCYSYSDESLYDNCRNINGVSKLFLLKFSVTLIVVQGLLQQVLTESGANLTPFQEDDKYSVAEKIQLTYCKKTITPALHTLFNAWISLCTGLVMLAELAVLSLWSYLTFRLPISSPEGDNLTFSHSTVSSYTPTSSVDCDSSGNDEQVHPVVTLLWCSIS